ncbi:TonB-dependent receptor domain-containing protein [Kordiimonas sp. SCSIO 12610]|uniref:TonB-dependent receptor domain-containing protein n=1 Tax=Kordiimonas sp. SCSIO 12610 TaxID=2829597 RepID=UPI002109F2D0|nr:TonB-dependent receptor [Kordiimonas sp. SCSIO 12610]UTW55751.1 TonB-dependent receptor [Kordiimonas sp. SCSIO 12610]
MSNFDLLKNRLSYGTASALIAAMGYLGTTGAVAQDDASVDDDSEVEEVVITGSRIKRSGIDNAQPNITLDRQDFDDRAFVNIADLLNETPAFGAPAASPNGNQAGLNIGQNIVNFLGLGSQRTLTVVNGRRFVSSNPPTFGSGANSGSQVDLNTIPFALIERVETIAIGGAPVYGSDAIAGTINVTLRDDFEGLSVSGRYGVTQRGDGSTYQIQSVIGGNFADGRGNVAFSMEFNSQPLLSNNARAFISDAEPFIGETNDVFNVFFDQNVQIVTPGGLLSPGSAIIPSLGVGQFPNVGGFVQFADNGDIVPFQAGTAPPGSAFFAAGGDGFDLFDDVGTIQTPLERVTLGGIGHYDITDNITAFFEFTLNNSRGTEFANQGGFQTFAFPNESGALQFGADNPFLTQQAANFLSDNGIDSFFVNRFNNDLVNNGEIDIDSTTYRVVSGLQGDFSIGERDFSWEVHTNFGSTDIDNFTTTVNDPRFINAIDAVALTDDTAGVIADGTAVVRNGETVFISSAAGLAAQAGDIVCNVVLQQALGTPGAGDPQNASGNGITDAEQPFVDGCVPLNLFGVGNATPEALAFVQALINTQTDIEQRVVAANFNGDLIDFGTGMIQFGVGWESRRETGSFGSSPLQNSGITRNSPAVDSGGTFTTSEFYGELVVPIVDPDWEIGESLFGETLINSASFEPAVRLVTTDIGGTSDTNTTYTLLGRVQVLNDFQFNGNYTRSIRTPALAELFTPVSNTFSFAADPCDSRNINNGQVPATRLANCESIGLGGVNGDFTSNIVNASVLGTTSGNPNLLPEVADSWTIGLAYSPRWIPGLRLRADYLSIQLRDRIQSLTLTTILQQCFDDPDFQTNPNPVCNAFTRDADGQIIDFATGQFNAANSDTRLVTFDARYSTPVDSILALFDSSFQDGDYGNLSWRLNGVRRIENRTQVNAAAPADPVIGSFGQPEWSATFDTTYTYEKFRLFHRIAWQNSALFSVVGDNTIELPDGSTPTRTGQRAIHSLTLSYQFFDELTAQVTINNLTDRRPNLLQQVSNDFGNAEIRGREFFFTLRANF